VKREITNLMSQKFGLFASKEFLPWFQKMVNASYVKMMGLDMSEFDEPSSYRTLNALFTRELRQPREFDLDGSVLISPADSLLSAQGVIKNLTALQIKGMSYSVDELLTDHFDADNRALLDGGEFINLYLSPKDYHRYHMPADLQVLKALHVPGKLYPVNFPSLKKRLNLFIENERVILECVSEQKKLLYIVLVGALNVGKMSVSFEPRIKTNTDTSEAKLYEYKELYLKKGDCFGYFEMGSTILLLAQNSLMTSSVDEGDKLKFAQSIAKLS